MARLNTFNCAIIGAPCPTPETCSNLVLGCMAKLNEKVKPKKPEYGADMMAKLEEEMRPKKTDVCPYCGRAGGDGHAADCPYDKALRETNATVRTDEPQIGRPKTCAHCGNQWRGQTGSACPKCGKVHEAQRLTVSQMLRDLAALYEERAGTYGKNYQHAGQVLMSMCQGPVTLETPEAFNRFHLLVHMAGKLSRYAATLKRGGHRDSLDDLAVYSMMAREMDELYGQEDR